MTTGNLHLLGKEVPYYVTSTEVEDGTLREVHLDLPVIPPSQVLTLMNTIAPYKDTFIDGIKNDLHALGMSGQQHSLDTIQTALETGHAAAFGSSCEIMKEQGPALYAVLPLSFNELFRETPKTFKTVKAAVLDISNKAVRATLLDQLLSGKKLDGELLVDGQDHVILPEEPVIRQLNREGKVCYYKKGSLRLQEQVLETEFRRVTDDTYAKVAFLGYSSLTGIVLWETEESGRVGLEPVVKWVTDQDGFKAFQFDSPVTRPSKDGKESNIHTSSLLGAVILAATCPDLGWPQKSAYKGAAREQSIGPLQATLLSIIASRNIMARSPFVEYVEQMESL